MIYLIQSSHHSINKKVVDGVYLSLNEKINTNSKYSKFNINDSLRIAKYKNISSQGYIENWSREIFIVDSVLKTDPWTYKIKDLNREKKIGSFYEKELILSIL